MGPEHPVLDALCHVLHSSNSNYIEVEEPKTDWMSLESALYMLITIVVLIAIVAYMKLFDRLMDRCIQTRVSRETHLRSKRVISVGCWGFVVTSVLLNFSGVRLEFFLIPIFFFFNTMATGFSMESKSKLSNGRFLSFSTIGFSTLLCWLSTVPLFLIFRQHHEYSKQCDKGFMSFTLIASLFLGAYLMLSIQSVRTYLLSKNASLLFIVDNKMPIGEYVRREEGWIEIYLDQNTVTQKLLPNKVAPIGDRVGYFHN